MWPASLLPSLGRFAHLSTLTLRTFVTVKVD
jgi:hypothetical protein